MSTDCPSRSWRFSAVAWVARGNRSGRPRGRAPRRPLARSCSGYRAGTILKVAVEDGQTVAVGKLVVVLEAMTMEQSRKAYIAGSVTGPQAEAGAIVANGVVICKLKDRQ